MMEFLVRRRGTGELVRTQIVERPESLDRILDQWDRLAVASSKPYCSPAWMMAWWRNVAPRSARLRVVLVFEDDALVGIAPFFVDRGLGGLHRYSVLGARCSSRVDLLAAPEQEEVVGEAIGRALSRSTPHPDVVMFHGIPATSPWPELLAAGWSDGRCRVQDDVRMPAPFLSLEGRTYEEWLTSKSRNFRNHMGRNKRKLEANGATLGLASVQQDLDLALRDLARLHYSRWRWRGGSAVLNTRIEQMLLDTARQQQSDLRFQLWQIRLPDGALSAYLFLSAGATTSALLGGFDEAWARFQPGMITILGAVEHAFSVGTSRIDLGGGDYGYKHRFANDTEMLRWTVLIPQGRAAALARFQFAPLRARIAIAQRLSPRAKHMLNRVAGSLKEWF
jgi:CelD/BcsL family acetyltransferase involved in cellulose biosynthesis